ncbi:hypothetical protein Emag_003672 [Eimeria magna]
MEEEVEWETPLRVMNELKGEMVIRNAQHKSASAASAHTAASHGVSWSALRVEMRCNPLAGIDGMIYCVQEIKFSHRNRVILRAAASALKLLESATFSIAHWKAKDRAVGLGRTESGVTRSISTWEIMKLNPTSAKTNDGCKHKESEPW